MGASQWRYMVAYQADVGAALQQLRQEVYDRGEYYREPADSDLDLTEEEFRARLDPRNDDDGFNDAIIEDWRDRKTPPGARRSGHLVCRATALRHTFNHRHDQRPVRSPRLRYGGPAHQ